MVNLLFYGGAFWLASIVFTVDLLVPSGVAVGLGYVIVVLVGLWAPTRVYFYFAAVTGTLLTALGYLVSPLSTALWEGVTNRMLSIVIIWMTTLLCLRLKPAPDP